LAFLIIVFFLVFFESCR